MTNVDKDQPACAACVHMAIEELVGGAPKSIRAAVWVIAAVISIAALGGFGLSAIESKATVAAAVATEPLKGDISELKAGQAQLWNVVNTKLDAISSQLAQTRQDVAVMGALQGKSK